MYVVYYKIIESIKIILDIKLEIGDHRINSCIFSQNWFFVKH